MNVLLSSQHRIDVRSYGTGGQEHRRWSVGRSPTIEELPKVRTFISLHLQAPDEAIEGGVVTLKVRPAGQQRPPDIEDEQVETVAFTVGPNTVNLTALDHPFDFGAMPTNLAGQTKSM